MLVSVEFAWGVVLVLVSWLTVLIVIVAAGSYPTRVLMPASAGWQRLRYSMWLGLAIMVLWVLVIGFFAPVVSLTAVLPLLGWAVISVILSHPKFTFAPIRGVRAYLALLAAAVVTGYFSLSALGPVTNYDSGLYHLGAIKYSGEFGTVTGLANLYPGLGYATAEFPLAAFLNNLFLGVQGFRILGGLIAVLLLIEVLARWLAPRVKRGPGDFVALVAITSFLVPMLWTADFWVTSPAQDFAAAALAIASAGYIVDALSTRRSEGNDSREVTYDLRIAVVLVALVIMFRPTMVLWALVMVVVISVVAWHGQRSTIWFLAGTGLVVTTVISARDFVLSGWLQYPLPLFPLPVPWRAPDPTILRDATLGFHRDPKAIWESATTFDWIGPWVGRLPGYWETYLFGGLGLLAVILFYMGRHSGRTFNGRDLATAISPSVIAIIGWFFLSPPSFRFAWGMWFSLLGILVGVALWRVPQKILRNNVGVVAAGGLITVSALAYVVKFDSAAINQQFLTPLGLNIAVASIELPAVEQKTSEAGFDYVSPITSDQCWDVYPLCTPGGAPQLQFRGDGIESGFLGQDRSGE